MLSNETPLYKLEAICKALDCQPGDLLRWEREEE